MPSSTTRLTNRSTYDTIAPLYARNQLRLRSEGPPSFDALRSAFGSSLPEAGLIADIGCGPGFDAADFAEMGLQVMGLDVSAGMLACADRTLVPRLAQADMAGTSFGHGPVGRDLVRRRAAPRGGKPHGGGAPRVRQSAWPGAASPW